MKYTTETYTSNYCYTPWDRSQSIPKTQYASDIPNTLETHLGTIEVFDNDCAFVPKVDVYSEFIENKQWKHCKKSDWYTHLLTGIKLKLEVVRSHELDYKNPGCGWETRTLTVKIPLPDGRGKNPNSHHNKPVVSGKTRDIKLTDEEWDKLKVLGEGKGYSQGVRNLLKYSSGV